MNDVKILIKVVMIFFRKSVHFESVLLLRYVHKINNQLLSTANAKDIKTDYYRTNNHLASRYHGSRA